MDVGKIPKKSSAYFHWPASQSAPCDQAQVVIPPVARTPQICLPSFRNANSAHATMSMITANCRANNGMEDVVGE